MLNAPLVGLLIRCDATSEGTLPGVDDVASERQLGATVSVLAFEVAGDRIKRIWAVRNPDKLRPCTAG
ncbi:hypothetical protein GCM10012278_65550 [Nonomuraea glycinis]|uniref:RNA polymerase subunit sigma-24 n=1 Tax=Nonomuraea glycinis TaxID=2047744 RepID=A0A918E7X0_9ACTN|nr:hypothetical protein GCM10012278_65550 [Nonomuraea glycinis]